MHKITKKLLAFLLCLSIVATPAMLFAVPVAQAAEQTVPLSATRYRYLFSRFENAAYQTGVNIMNAPTTSGNLFTNSKVSGDGDDKLFKASIELYDMFNMKVGKNRALCIRPLGINVNNSTEQASFEFIMGEKVGTRTNIFPESISGIPDNATDHGVIFHWEQTGLEGTNDSYTIAKRDTDGNATTELEPHAAISVNVTFQEVDYKADGKVNIKGGSAIHSAYHAAEGVKVTLIWTKDVSWTNTDPEKYTELKREKNGMPVKDKDGNLVYQPIPSYSHKAGDTELWELYSYNAKGQYLAGGGEIYLPRDFCGYVIAPFSCFVQCWNGGNKDSMLNLKNLELAVMYVWINGRDKGRIFIDEFGFYGPTFANVDGAYDYGELTFANHKDSLNNRKLITIKEEEKSEEPSKEAPKVIETAVTLENKATGIKLEAPTSAKIAAGTTLTVEQVEKEENLYNKQLFEEFFGDASNYRDYLIYLGAEGDQEPEDFVQLTIPVPEGFDADKCEVCMIGASGEKLPVTYEFSADKKNVLVKTDSLGTFVIAKTDGKPAGEDASETASEGEKASADDEQNAGKVADGEKEAAGNLTWLWIVIGAVVLVGAGVAVFFIIKGKKSKESETPEEDKE